MIASGSAFLSYDIITEWLRHHDEANQRPKLIDHLFAMSLIGTVGGFMAFNTFRGAFQGFLYVGMNIGLLSYWAMAMGNQAGASFSPSNVYYDADVSPAEKERIEMLDQQNILAWNMTCKPGYGLVQLQSKYLQ